jgi:hypothetical protein
LRERLLPKKEDSLLPTECNQDFLEFHPVGKRDVRGGFDGGTITSDAGEVLLREVEKRTRIITQFGAGASDSWCWESAIPKGPLSSKVRRRWM